MCLALASASLAAVSFRPEPQPSTLPGVRVDWLTASLSERYVAEEVKAREAERAMNGVPWSYLEMPRLPPQERGPIHCSSLSCGTDWMMDRLRCEIGAFVWHLRRAGYENDHLADRAVESVSIDSPIACLYGPVEWRRSARGHFIELRCGSGMIGGKTSTATIRVEPRPRRAPVGISARLAASIERALAHPARVSWWTALVLLTCAVATAISNLARRGGAAPRRWKAAVILALASMAVVGGLRAWAAMDRASASDGEPASRVPLPDTRTCVIECRATPVTSGEMWELE